MTDQSSPAVFVSRDMWLSASLMTLGMPLLRVEFIPRRPTERPGPPWAVFVLEDHADRPLWVKEYNQNSLSLPVRQVARAINHLRDQMRASSDARRGEA